MPIAPPTNKVFFLNESFVPSFLNLGPFIEKRFFLVFPFIYIYESLISQPEKKKKKKLHLNARCTSKLYLYGYDCMINLLEGKNQIEILVCQRYLFIPVSPECDPTQYKSLNKSARQHSWPYSLQTQWGKKKKVSPKVM